MRFRINAFVYLLGAAQIVLAQSSTPLLTDFTASTLRNNFSGWVGTKFTTGSTPLTVTSLGRIYIAGNTGVHTVKLVRASDGTDVPGATAPVSMAGGAAGQFTYAPVTVTLQTNTAYYLVSQETAGGDQWYDYTPVVPANAVTVDASVYWNGYQWVTVDTPKTSYVPVNLLYTTATTSTSITITNPINNALLTGAPGSVLVLATVTPGTGVTISGVQFKLDGANLGVLLTTAPFAATLNYSNLTPGTHTLSATAADSSGYTATAPVVSIIVGGAPLITAFNPGPLRNNYTGWVGMQFTTGTSPMTVTALGRIYLSPTNQQHTIKLARVSDGADVPGSVVVTSPGNVTTFDKYLMVMLATPLVLPANTSYYLVSQETGGGDPWYDFSQVTATSAGTVNGPVYWDGYKYFLLSDHSGASYVPVNLLYSTVAAGPTVTMTSPAYGSTYDSGASVTLAAVATPSPGASITGVQFFTNGQPIGPPITSPPFTKVVDAGSLVTTQTGSQGLWAVATDSAGKSATSPTIGIRVIVLPSVSITAPAQSSTVSGTLKMMASAQSVYIYYTIVFQVDGKVVGSQAFGHTPPPPPVLLDTTTLANGSHIATATIADANGTGSAAPVTFFVNNTPPSSQAFVTGFMPGALRNNYGNWVGMQFTTGSASISVTSLGRIYVPGNAGSHVLKLVRASDGLDVPGGSVTDAVPTGTPGNFTYASLTTPVTLASNTSYYLVSLEQYGSDQWYDYGQVTTTNAATVNGPVYWDGYHWFPVGIAGNSYVPVNFLMATVAAGMSVSIVLPGAVVRPGDAVSAVVAGNTGSTSVQFQYDGLVLTPLVTSAPYSQTVPALNLGPHTVSVTTTDSVGHTATALQPFTQGRPMWETADVNLVNFVPGTLRNNFSGWVGFKFTTTAQPVSGYGFNEIGRVCASGNSGLHIVKVVRASDGVDVASALFNMSACSDGRTTVYAPVGLALTPLTSYYLVSQEVAGGDQWYDVNPAAPHDYLGFGQLPSVQAAFTIDGPVYWNTFQWVVVPSSPNRSYVGLVLAAGLIPIPL